ncbi:MAG: adenosylcobinamide-phosphate synthase CbiB [Gemmatimonas sp.]
MRTGAVNALLVDLIAGEPPSALHPTVWMGRWIAGGRTHRTSRRNASSFAEGAFTIGSGALLAFVAASMLERAVRRVPRSVRNVTDGIALKPALSLRPLISAAQKIRRALEHDDLVRARELLAMHLVSRDTSQLTEDEVAGAAIESVAENLSDSVVAPLLAYRLGGLSAAYTYRFLNTADAMLGYRTPELEWFGKSAARADDIANFVPARVTALLITACASAGDGSAAHALRVAKADARRTDSPNAGWPMGAMAGALDIRLTKRGQYVLNNQGYTPIPRDITRCCRIAVAASACAAVLVDTL